MEVQRFDDGDRSYARRADCTKELAWFHPSDISCDLGCDCPMSASCLSFLTLLSSSCLVDMVNPE